MKHLLHCSGVNCHNFLLRSPHRVLLHEKHYCSTSCLGSSKRNPAYVDMICETCHNLFRPKVPWVKDRPHRFCSIACRLADQRTIRLKKWKLTQDEIAEAARLYGEGATVKSLEKQFETNSTNMYRFLNDYGIKWRPRTFGPDGPTNRINFTETQIEEIKFLYGFGWSTKHIAAELKMKSHGPILRLLRTLGLTRTHFDPCRRLQSEDGHFVRSSAELMVDDWLYNHGIAHSYEPKLTVDPHYHADFFARGYYIELWGGGPNQKAYKRTMVKKLALYQTHNLPLICLTWEQTLKSLDEVLGILL